MIMNLNDSCKLYSKWLRLEEENSKPCKLNFVKCFIWEEITILACNTENM